MSNFGYLNKLGRASAVLTTGEVAGASLLLDNVWGGQVVSQFNFTLGMLTNVIVKAYVSMDNVTFFPLTDDDGTPFTQTITATDTRAVINHCSGWKYFRLSVTGTGTVTNSLCDFTYRGLKVGSQ